VIVELADDIAAALDANPAAAAFFDTLAQFYRKAYLRYIDATTRRPDLRAARIAEVVDLLGHRSENGHDRERNSPLTGWAMAEAAAPRKRWDTDERFADVVLPRVWPLASCWYWSRTGVSGWMAVSGTTILPQAAGAASRASTAALLPSALAASCAPGPGAPCFFPPYRGLGTP
jgi:hypothetical protein